MTHSTTHRQDTCAHAAHAPVDQLLADHFALYIKTKGFHWHIGGPHFRDYHHMS